ncbi:MAG: XdhC family protein [Verrucomicrobia bacterium]|nr:XdhC family protein [Verrucomicrobiota bacterium]
MSWKEFRQIIAFYRKRTGPFALATLVRAVGSSYRQPGARMLVCTDGTFCGALSAGCLEEELIETALQVIRTGVNRLVSFDLRPRFACDGTIDIFLERISKPNDFIDSLVRIQGYRISFYGITDLTRLTGENCTSTTLQPPPKSPGLFISKINPPIRLVLVGTHFDAKPVALLASEFLGWEVVPMVDASQMPIGDKLSACVVMSHHFGRDLVALNLASERGYGYIGLLGSRRRKHRVLEQLAEHCGGQISQIYSPVGLDLGGEAPEEIALSIVTEVQAVLNQRSASSLTHLGYSIHAMRETDLWDQQLSLS